MNDPINMQTGQQPIFFRMVYQTEWRAFLPEKISWVRIKGDNSYHQPVAFGRLTGRHNKFLMAAMHTIKIANSGRERRPIPGGITYLPTDQFGHFSLILYHRRHYIAERPKISIFVRMNNEKPPQTAQPWGGIAKQKDCIMQFAFDRVKRRLQTAKHAMPV